MATLNTMPPNSWPPSSDDMGSGGVSPEVLAGLANKVDIATDFSDLTNYSAGDLVYYEGALYEFQVDHAAGAWESSEAIQKDLSDIINSKGSGLPDYSTTEQDTGLKWIDGKTVYEKTCPVALHGNSDYDTLLVSNTSISNAWIVNSDFILSAGGEEIHFNLSANVNGVWTTGFLIKKSNGLYLRSKNAYAGADGANGYVTIRYVKTTA